MTYPKQRPLAATPTTPTTPISTTILLFEAASKLAVTLEDELAGYGHQVLATLLLSDGLLGPVSQYRPDIVVLDLCCLDSTLLESMRELQRVHPLPVIIFADTQAPQIIEQAVKAGVSAYVVDDLQPERLTSIITVAMVRFSEYRRLTEELEQTKNKLAARKLLERAKGLLMQRQGISEDQAYQRLRKMAMDKGQSLATVAQTVVDVLTMCEPLNDDQAP